MAENNGRGQSWVAYAGLVLAICTTVYSAGALGQRVEEQDKRLVKLEAQQTEWGDIRERLARIEERLIAMQEHRRQ